VHMLVATLVVAGFTTLRRAGHLHKCNEAMLGLLSLRLTHSRVGASTDGLLHTPPELLFDERAIAKVTTFQVTRSARLVLAHQTSLTFPCVKDLCI
jgi:hypothetical protein